MFLQNQVLLKNTILRLRPSNRFQLFLVKEKASLRQWFQVYTNISVHIDIYTCLISYI
jgi:hypothetical protein